MATHGSESEEARIKIVDLPFGVGKPLMAIDGTHYYVVIARFSTWIGAERYIATYERRDLVILDMTF